MIIVLLLKKFISEYDLQLSKCLLSRLQFNFSKEITNSLRI